jgi:N-acetylmuramoyl-L-alanine amidase
VLEEPKNEEPQKSTSETETEKSPVKTESSEIIFKVQIAAANKKLDLIPSNFKGLTNVQATTDNGQLYKYTYGETTDYAVAKNNLAEAKDKGYSSAYIIAYKDGKKISVQDALK